MIVIGAELALYNPTALIASFAARKLAPQCLHLRFARSRVASCQRTTASHVPGSYLQRELRSPASSRHVHCSLFSASEDRRDAEGCAGPLLSVPCRQRLCGSQRAPTGRCPHVRNGNRADWPRARKWRPLLLQLLHLRGVLFNFGDTLLASVLLPASRQKAETRKTEARSREIMRRCQLRGQVLVLLSSLLVQRWFAACCMLAAA